MGMLEGIIAEAKALEQEAIHAEEDAQKSYEEVKVDTIKNCFASWDDRRVALLAAKGGPVDW